jgi:hypothetical protein
MSFATDKKKVNDKTEKVDCVGSCRARYSYHRRTLGQGDSATEKYRKTSGSL